MSINWKDVSYILGQQIGADFKTQEIEVDFDTFSQSIKAAYNGEAGTMSTEQVQSVMQEFQQLMQDKHSARTQEEAAVNAEAGLKYLEDNKAQDGIITLDSGLQYRVITEGTGKKPAATDTVETHYEGKLIDGSVFDSSYQRGQTATFPVNGVIPGWTEALQLMGEGAKWQLFIPSTLAYGEAGSPPVIPPSATLIFDVELVSVK